MKPDPRDAAARVPWLELCRVPALWGIVLARLLTDQVWYFCLFWMPGYLQENLHLTLLQAGVIGWVPFLCADVGGVASGLVSDRLVRRGLAPGQARKRVVTIAALAGPAAWLVPMAPNAAWAVAAFCVLATVCQIWLFNITTLVSDTFPRTSVATVLGMSGSFGAFGGMVSSQLIGVSVKSFGFTPVFIALGTLHLAGAMVIAKLVRPERGRS